MSLFSRTENLIGLDIGTHSIKMVQVRSDDARPRLISMGIVPMPSDVLLEGRVVKPEIVASAVRQLSTHLKVRKKSAAICISGYDVMIKKIELPTMTEEELETRMQAELGQYIPYNVEEVDIDYQVLDVVKDRANFMEVLLVAAKKESVGDYSNLLKLSGFEPHVVDVDFFALGNAFESTHGQDEESIALLDIGASKAVMNITCKGTPIFTRGISIGGNQITETIRDQFKITDQEAENVKLGEAVENYPAREIEEIFVSTVRSWVNECSRAVDFYYNNYPDKRIKALYISGGSSRIPGLDKVFNESMEVPVEIFNPLSRAQYDPNQFDPAYIDYIGPQMAISLGLALRKTKEK